MNALNYFFERTVTTVTHWYIVTGLFAFLNYLNAFLTLVIIVFFLVIQLKRRLINVTRPDL